MKVSEGKACERECDDLESKKHAKYTPPSHNGDCRLTEEESMEGRNNEKRDGVLPQMFSLW